MMRDRSPEAVARAFQQAHNDHGGVFVLCSYSDMADVVRAVRRECARVARRAFPGKRGKLTKFGEAFYAGRDSAARDILALNRAPRGGRRG